MAKQNTFELRGEHAVLFCPDKSGFLHQVLVDEDKLPKIIAFGFWRTYNTSTNPDKPLLYVYARNGRQRTILLHRFVMNAPKGAMVDHQYHSTLDNRIESLRFTTRSQNALNQRRSKNMCIWKRFNRYRVYVKINDKSRWLGSFETQQEARDRRDEFLRTQGVQL